MKLAKPYRRAPDPSPRSTSARVSSPRPEAPRLAVCILPARLFRAYSVCVFYFQQVTHNTVCVVFNINDISLPFFTLWQIYTRTYTHAHNLPCLTELLHNICVHIQYISGQSSSDSNKWNRPSHSRGGCEARPRDVRPTFTLGRHDSPLCPPGGPATCRPTAHDEERPPYTCAQPPLDHHLTLISARPMGERCYRAPVFCAVPTVTSEADLNDADCQRAISTH